MNRLEFSLNQWNLRLNQIASKKKHDGSAAITFGANLEYLVRLLRSSRVSEYDWPMERRDHICE